MYKIALTIPKKIYGTVCAALSLTTDIQLAMLGLLLCLLFDTITGFIAAPYRKQRRTSCGLRKVVPKIITYFTAGLLVHICETWIFPSWVGNVEFAKLVFSFFAGIEIMSCFENMKDITGLKAFDLLTLNFKSKVEETVGVKLKKE